MISKTLVASLFIVATAAGPAAHAAEDTLYQRIGGEPVMVKVVDQMLMTLARDPAVNQSFANVNLPKLSRKLYVHMCAATGGDCVYAGDDMKTVHAGLHIGRREVDAASVALVAALDANGVGVREKNELLQLIAPLEAQVISP